MLRLSKTQSQVVQHNEGALLVIAGPGSGKTRVLTERIRRLLKEDEGHFRILALTFTNKAANEMAERLEDVPNIIDRAFIGTLHSFCAEVLANRGKAVGISGLPNIFDSYQDRKQMLEEAAKVVPSARMELATARDSRDRSRKLDQWLSRIGESKSNLILPEMDQDEDFKALYSAYNDQLRASNAVDFDDLLLLTYKLFEERPKIADFYRRQYKYICIDEAQDLNEAQYRVICALCGRDYFNLMMVGDPKQAIFMWNGAHPKYLELFCQDFKAKAIELKENFRSSQLVVEAAKKLDGQYSVEGVLPVKGAVEIDQFCDESEEAESISNKLLELFANGHSDIEGKVTPERCAIIGRNRFVFSEIVGSLKNAEIPFYQKVSSASVRSESDEVIELELSLRVLANPLDRLHLGILLVRWKVPMSVDECYREFDLRLVTGEQLLRLIEPHAQGTSGLIYNCLEAMGWARDSFRLSKALDTIEEQIAEHKADLRALVLEDISEWRKHWDFYLRTIRGGGQSIPSFLSQLALGTTQQPREDGVALLTVHASKGMEFDVVFLPSMVEGVFPDFRAQGADLVEEQRNAFVAVTRSRRLLYVSYPKTRVMPWGDARRQTPSRFVQMIR